MTRVLWLSLGIFLATNVFAEAQDIRAARIAAQRLTIAETVLATTSQLNDRVGSPIKDVSWTSQVGDRNWSLRMRGSSERGPIEIGFGGFLWGNEDEDWVVNYSGGGRIGGEPIQINGRMEWPRAGRPTAIFNQAAKFGEHSTWGWIVGAEVTVGLTVGGTVAFLGTAAVPPAAFLIAIWGGATGATTAVTLSKIARETIEGEGPPQPPPAPPAPAPKKDDKLTPQADVLYVTLAKDGSVTGNGPDPRCSLEGKADNATTSGEVICR